jgi:hypothetical protein
LIRNCFIREEGESLIVGSGIAKDWLSDVPVGYGPAPTAFGRVTVSMATEVYGVSELQVNVSADWHGAAPEVLVNVPGYLPTVMPAGSDSVFIAPLPVAGE